jgi:hypothetical protein
MPHFVGSRLAVRNVTAAVVAAGEDPVATYRTKGTLASGGGAVASVGSLNIVDAAEDLLLIITATIGSSRSFTSGTITPDGESPISITSVYTTAGRAMMFRADIPSGTDLTNATLAITYSSQPTTYGTASFWTVPAADLNSTTPVDSDAAASAAAITLTVNISTSDGGCYVAAARNTDNSSNSSEWTGDEPPVEDFDTDTQGCTGANAAGTGAATNDNEITVTWPSSGAVDLVAASWR